MPKRKNDFDEFMKEVAKDSAAAGETEAFEAYGEHFRLALQVIQLRKERNWTQQQLAKASGVQQSEISRIERGQATCATGSRRRANWRARCSGTRSTRG